jgi:hypothetical protein
MVSFYLSILLWARRAIHAAGLSLCAHQGYAGNTGPDDPRLAGLALIYAKSFAVCGGRPGGSGSSFLQKLRLLSPVRVYSRFLLVQAILLLPVSGYAIIVAGVAWYGREKGAAAAVLSYIMLLTVSGTFRITYKIAHSTSAQTRRHTGRRGIPYWLILLRFLWSENKVLLLGIKLFGCVSLYFLLRNQNPSDHDIRMALLVFSLAMFGHGPLFHKCRQMDNTQLRCYRAMPVPLGSRFTYIAHLLWPAPDTGNADAGLAHAISHPGIRCFVVCWIGLLPAAIALLPVVSRTYVNG